MAVPKKRKSYSRTRLKLGSPKYQLKPSNYITCKKCLKRVRPHVLHDHGAVCITGSI